MPKLKLKSKTETRDGRKSERQKDAKYVQEQTQSKLSNFFSLDQDEDTEENVSNIKKTMSKYFDRELKQDSDELDESGSDFKPEKIKRVECNTEKKQVKSKKGKSPRASKNKSSNLKRSLQQYSKDFEEVCAIGGIDINPEQLQLAIALSRSLTDFQGSAETKDEAGPSQDGSGPSTVEYESEDVKVKRIRKTLDQYGFKVPVGPIHLKVNTKRKRNQNKLAKSILVTRTLEEKKQITSTIVSQILFESNIENHIETQVQQTNLSSSLLNDVWCRSLPIYTKASFMFDEMDELDVFYVKNLITPSDAKIGCLLKDWNAIPGRDKSPERTRQTLDFRETVLYPDHLDLLLSSTCSYLNDKIDMIQNSPTVKNCNRISSNDNSIINPLNESVQIIQSNPDVITIEDNSRSCSPDIFEDESYYEETFKETIVSDKNDMIKHSHVQIDSSDDELPNVYFSQPNKLEDLSKNLQTSTESIDLTLNYEFTCETKCSNETNNTNKSVNCYTSENCKSPCNYKSYDAEIDDSLDENSKFKIPKNTLNLNVQICDSISAVDDFKESQHEENESFCINSPREIKKVKISLGSFDNTVKFDELLKEFKTNQANADTSVESKNTSESIDLTQDDYSSGHNSSEISKRREFSQIYESQNGIIHFETFHEDVDLLNVSISESPNVILKQNNRNINDVSLSSLECDQNKSNEFLFDSVFENSNSCNVKSFKEKEVDLTQLSQELNESDQNERSILKCSQNAESLLKDSQSEVSLDVFVLSDEEFNYSISKSNRSKSNAYKNINCNDVSDSEDESNISDRFHKSNSHSSSSDYEIKNDSIECIYDEKIINPIENNESHENNIEYRISNKFNLYGSSFFDQIPSYMSLPNITKRESTDKGRSMINLKDSIVKTNFDETNELPAVYLGSKQDNNMCNISTKQSKLDDVQNHKNSPMKNMSAAPSLMDTPNLKYIIKTDNVTPIPNYCAMDTPQIHKELSKYGLKPLKRKRAVQMLEHIYNQTHPLVETSEVEKRVKRRKLNYNNENTNILQSETRGSNVADELCEKITGETNKNQPFYEKIGNNSSMASNPVSDDIYSPDSHKIELKQIDCNPEDWVFQTREKSKIHGCRVPLHIAFHNYVSVRSKLKDAILRYDPVNIDTIHRGLVSDGYRYNSKDLFHFMDKKCITIKTTDKSGPTRHQKKRK